MMMVMITMMQMIMDPDSSVNDYDYVVDDGDDVDKVNDYCSDDGHDADGDNL